MRLPVVEDGLNVSLSELMWRSDLFAITLAADCLRTC